MATYARLHGCILVCIGLARPTDRLVRGNLLLARHANRQTEEGKIALTAERPKTRPDAPWGPASAVHLKSRFEGHWTDGNEILTGHQSRVGTRETKLQRQLHRESPTLAAPRRDGNFDLHLPPRRRCDPMFYGVYYRIRFSMISVEKFLWIEIFVDFFDTVWYHVLS